MSIQRLDHALKQKNIPIHGVSGRQGNIRVDYKPEATAEQMVQAENIVSNFNWSAEAESAWQIQQDREKTSINLNEDKISRLIVLVLLEEINSIRDAVSLPRRTIAQLRNSLLTKLNNGNVD